MGGVFPNFYMTNFDKHIFLQPRSGSLPHTRTCHPTQIPKRQNCHICASPAPDSAILAKRSPVFPLGMKCAAGHLSPVSKAYLCSPVCHPEGNRPRYGRLPNVTTHSERTDPFRMTNVARTRNLQTRNLQT